jgi:hypothetical protein
MVTFWLSAGPRVRATRHRKRLYRKPVSEWIDSQPIDEF